jgi:hypothetical protein
MGKKFWLTAMGVLGVGTLGFAVGMWDAEPGHRLVVYVLIGIGCGLVLTGFMSVIWVLTVRRDVPTLDRETRKAVQHALRVGHTDDPRIDQQTRDLIARSPRMRWAPYLYAVLALLSLLLLISASGTWQYVRHAATMALWIGLAAMSVVQRRRLESYRGLDVDKPS